MSTTSDTEIIKILTAMHTTAVKIGELLKELKKTGHTQDEDAGQLPSKRVLDDAYVAMVTKSVTGTVRRAYRARGKTVAIAAQLITELANNGKTPLSAEELSTRVNQPYDTVLYIMRAMRRSKYITTTAKSFGLVGRPTNYYTIATTR